MDLPDLHHLEYLHIEAKNRLNKGRLRRDFGIYLAFCSIERSISEMLCSYPAVAFSRFLVGLE